MGLLGIDDQAQPIERIVGRIGLDQRCEAVAAVERALPEVEIAGLAFPDAGMVAVFLCFERCHDAKDALLADLHAAADAHILQEGMAHQLLPAGNDARGRAAEEFVAGIKRDIRALFEKDAQVIFRGRIDDDRHALGMGNLDEFLEIQQAVVDDMVGDDIDGGGGLVGDGVFHVEAMRRGRLPDKNDLAAGKRITGRPGRRN